MRPTTTPELPSRTEATPQRGGEGAYDVVSLGEGWGIVSLTFFAMSLATRPLLSLVPAQYRGWNYIPPLAVTLVPVLAGLGLLCAFFGKRTKGSPSRIALYLNAVVLGISALLVLIILTVRFVLR